MYYNAEERDNDAVNQFNLDNYSIIYIMRFSVISYREIENDSTVRIENTDKILVV